MTFQPLEFSRKISEVEENISQALQGIPSDERLFALRDLLLAQVRVCDIHYRLMQLEKDNRLLLSDAAASSMMDKHLELAKFFRELPKSEQKPTYEMESIISLYKFISHHFADDET